jgi:hypothetical protein
MNKDLRKKPRWLEHLKATIGGYFWLPCPICGEYFGGHEKDSGSWYQGQGGGAVVCVNCSKEGEARGRIESKKEGMIITSYSKK